MASNSSDKILSKHSQMQSAKTKQQQLPRPSSLLLKDYLIRDDLSLCSSNGFKSFPRRQCCNTVGLILGEKDLKLQQQRKRRISRRRKRNNTTLLLPQPPHSTSSSSFSSSKVSVLQRASEAIINAIKSMPPLSSPKNGSAKKTTASGLLSRSFSSRLLSRSFWRNAAKEDHQRSGEGTQRWRTSFRELLMLERNKTASLNEDNVFTAVSSSSSASSSGCGSNNSWGESEFTFPSSTAAASESSSQNDVAEGTKEVALHHKIKEVTKDWQNVEKEQFSPVSVLDCPFEDDEGIAPHFNSTTHSFLEGAEQKHIQKRRHFESVASVELVALEKRMAWPELEEEEEEEPHNNSTKHAVSVPIMCTQNGNSNVFHYNIEDNARDLLDSVKRSIPSNCLVIKAESLLFDYFNQSIGENIVDIDHNYQSNKLHLCKVAEDWIQGQPKEVYLGWEVQEGRQIYIKEMDKCVEWRNTDQEVQQLALELENEVFTSLVNELIVYYLTMC